MLMYILNLFLRTSIIFTALHVVDYYTTQIVCMYSRTSEGGPQSGEAFFYIGLIHSADKNGRRSELSPKTDKIQ